MGLFKKREDASNEEVRCPNCGYVQRMEKHVLSIFCKRCMNRIVASKDPDKAKPVAQQPIAKITPLNEKNSVKCSKCGAMNLVPEEALSVFCSKCSETISIKQDTQSAKNVHGKSFSEGSRTVKCYTCSNLQTVSMSAMSAFCSGCGNRIELMDFQIKDKCLDKVLTRGKLHVMSSGKLIADVNAMSARIDGEVRGNVYVEDKLVIGQKGRVFGDIVARRMELEKGALYTGNVHLNATDLSMDLLKEEEREKAEKI